MDFVLGDWRLVFGAPTFRVPKLGGGLPPISHCSPLRIYLIEE